MNPPAATPGDLATGGEPGAPGMEPGDACGMNPAGAGAMQNERGGPGLAGPKGDRPGLTAEGEGDLETGGRPAPMPKAVLAPKVKSGSTAEGRHGDKAGKSVKLERQQVSKVRSHSASTSLVRDRSTRPKCRSQSASHFQERLRSMICRLACSWWVVLARSNISSGATTSCSSIPVRERWWRSSLA